MKKLIEERKKETGRLTEFNNKAASDSIKKQTDFFQTEFGEEKKDSVTTGKVIEEGPDAREPVLRKAKLYEYRPPKYFTDYVVSGFNNTVLTVNKFQTYGGGAGPIYLSNGNSFNGLIRMGTSDLMEDYKFAGGIRLASNLVDNDVLFNFTNQRKRLDWGVTYFRSSNTIGITKSNGSFDAKEYESYYLVNLKYPLDRVRALKASVGPRFNRIVISSVGRLSLQEPDIKSSYAQMSLEYVYDNSVNPASNIWHGLRYKVFTDFFTQISNTSGLKMKDRMLFNMGFDARHYLPIYRNLIWAVRGAGDFSWGEQKVVYYLGGVDNWFSPKFNDANPPDQTQGYAYQSLAVNLRGFPQNVSNGNNSLVINSEVRVPVFTTFFNKPINNAFLRNFQIVQFFDLGAAWTGEPWKIERPSVIYSEPGNPATVRLKAGGIGPFAGGYGFGARSTLLGYFLRVDAAWEMNVFFKGKPMWYFAMGFDF